MPLQLGVLIVGERVVLEADLEQPHHFGSAVGGLVLLDEGLLEVDVEFLRMHLVDVERDCLDGVERVDLAVELDELELVPLDVVQDRETLVLILQVVGDDAGQQHLQPLVQHPVELASLLEDRLENHQRLARVGQSLPPLVYVRDHIADYHLDLLLHLHRVVHSALLFQFGRNYVRLIQFHQALQIHEQILLAVQVQTRQTLIFQK